MKFQEKPYSCGAACTRNAMSALGLDLSEKLCRHFAGTNRKGTLARGIKKALRECGHGAEIFACSAAKKAMERLNRELRAGAPVILCVDNFSHWVLVLGRVRVYFYHPNSKPWDVWNFLVADPDRDSQKARKQGVVQVWSGQELRDRWQHIRGGFHGIVIHPR